MLPRSHGPIKNLHRIGYRGGLNYGRLRRVDVERTPSPTPSSDDETPTSDSESEFSTDSTTMTAGSSLPYVQSESSVTPEGWGIPYSESPPLSYSNNYPLRPHSPTSRTRTTPAFNSGSIMNSAVFNT
jgi:hypothetical protein